MFKRQWLQAVAAVILGAGDPSAPRNTVRSNGRRKRSASKAVSAAHQRRMKKKKRNIQKRLPK